MLLFDLAVQGTVGAVFALGARERLAREPQPLRDPAVRDGLLYSALLYVPSAMFFLVGWPGWNSMYLFDLDRQRAYFSAFAAFDTVALFGCFVAGFLGSAWIFRRRGARSLPVLASLALLWSIVYLVLFVGCWGRSFAVTTYQDFHARQWPRFVLRWGESDSFFGRPIMWWLLGWAVLDFVPLGVIYATSRKSAAPG